MGRVWQTGLDTRDPGMGAEEWQKPHHLATASCCMRILYVTWHHSLSFFVSILEISHHMDRIFWVTKREGGTESEGKNIVICTGREKAGQGRA